MGVKFDTMNTDGGALKKQKFFRAFVFLIVFFCHPRAPAPYSDRKSRIHNHKIIYISNELDPVFTDDYIIATGWHREVDTEIIKLI